MSASKIAAWWRLTGTPIETSAMPDEYKSENVVKSYRDYYASKDKMRYPKGKAPDWFVSRRKIPFIEC